MILLPAPVAETFGFCYVSVDALDIPFRILGFRKGGCRLFLFIVRRKDSADALLPFVPDAAHSASLRHIAVKIPKLSLRQSTNLLAFCLAAYPQAPLSTNVLLWQVYSRISLVFRLQQVLARP